MRVWAGVVLLPTLLLVVWASTGGAERKEGGRGRGGGGRGGRVDTCKDGVDERPHLSLTTRTQRAQVVFYGFVTRVYKKKGRQTYPAEFFIVNVFKGADLMARLLGVDGGYGGVYNLRDKRINVTNFGPRAACLSPLEEQRTFIILATVSGKTQQRLRAHYDHPGSAAVQWSKENEEEVWRALGWDGWSDWSGCSASCDGGTQERRRYCLHARGCQGYNTEKRRCNFFSCNGTLDVLHLQDMQYKPSKFGWRESSTRPGSWRAVRNRPLLVHTRDIYPGGFPSEFSLLVTVRPDLGNMGMLFIMHRAYGGEVYLGLGLGTGLELLHTGPTRDDDLLPINVAPINVNLTDGHWHQLAISVLEDNSIQVYVDCRWISRQILRRSTLEIPMDTLLYVGGMPGRSYQGEMEQFTLSRSPDAVAKQCKAEPIPVIDDTLQDAGRPLGLVMQEYTDQNQDEDYPEDYGDYDYPNYDYGQGYDPYHSGAGYDNFPDYVYDNFDDFDTGREHPDWTDGDDVNGGEKDDDDGDDGREENDDEKEEGRYPEDEVRVVEDGGREEEDEGRDAYIDEKEKSDGDREMDGASSEVDQMEADDQLPTAATPADKSTYLEASNGRMSPTTTVENEDEEDRESEGELNEARRREDEIDNDDDDGLSEPDALERREEDKLEKEGDHQRKVNDERGQASEGRIRGESDRQRVMGIAADGVEADTWRATDDEDLLEGSGGSGHEKKFELMWSVWSGCSTSCDGGVRIRSYRCLPNQLMFEECVHAGIETQEQRACNLQPCPSTTTTTVSPATAATNATTTTTTTSTPATTLTTPSAAGNVLDSIPYVTLTNNLSVSPVDASDQLASSTSNRPSPPPASATSSAPPTSASQGRHRIDMHPLYPTLVAGQSTFPRPYNMSSSSSLGPPNAKPLKPSKEDMGDVTINSGWPQTQSVTGRDMNEVLPRWEGETTTSDSGRGGVDDGRSSKASQKWTYQYNHNINHRDHHLHHHNYHHNQQLLPHDPQQHRMRHRHHKQSVGVTTGQECGGGCLNQGLCGYGDVCHCARGWHGRRCELAQCIPPGCVNGGVCVAPDTCRCPPGYSGNRCQDAVCVPPCSNGGTCVLPGLCACPSGFMSPSCAPMCTSRCLHGGECTGVERCTCPAGYTGSRCESAVCSPPCRNGGRCVAPGVCSCPQGYGGQRCTRPVCRPQCQNGGRCIAPYLCSCPAGTLGNYCHKFLCSRGCGVGGQCVGVEMCRCGRGYSGPSCTVPVCDPPCSNGGTCTSPGVCTCPEGYSGLWCTAKKCKYVPRQVAYTRSYTKMVPQRVQTHCGAWGWKTCTSVRQVPQTVTQKFYRTVYTCEPTA